MVDSDDKTTEAALVDRENLDASELNPEWVAALRESSLDSIEPRLNEWDGFDAAVWARIDEGDGEEASVAGDALGASEPHWDVIREALRADHASAIAAFEAQLEEFADGVALRWAEDADASGPSLGDVMRAEVGAEMEGKTGAWSAFVHQVLHTIGRHEQRALEAEPGGFAQALRDEVDSELDAVAHRFDGDFREGIERKIFRAAREPKPWWSRLGTDLADWIFRPTPAFGLAAAAVVALFWVVGPGSAPEPLTKPVTASIGAPGTVSISAVRFGGAVTVMPDDGIAVVWVSEDDGLR